jgi:hypothetical protein
MEKTRDRERLWSKSTDAISRQAHTQARQNLCASGISHRQWGELEIEDKSGESRLGKANGYGEFKNH